MQTHPQQSSSVKIEDEITPQAIGGLDDKALDDFMNRLQSEITALDSKIRAALIRRGQLLVRSDRLNDKESQEAGRLVSEISVGQQRLLTLKGLLHKGGEHARLRQEHRRQETEGLKTRINNYQRLLKPEGQYARKIDDAKRTLERSLKALKAAEEERAQAEEALQRLVEQLEAKQAAL